MTGRFKRFVHSNEKMSRTTEYRRRKAKLHGTLNLHVKTKVGEFKVVSLPASGPSVIDNHENAGLGEDHYHIQTEALPDVGIASSSQPGLLLLKKQPQRSFCNNEDETMETPNKSYDENPSTNQEDVDVMLEPERNEVNKSFEEPIDTTSGNHEQVSVPSSEPEDSDCGEHFQEIPNQEPFSKIIQDEKDSKMNSRVCQSCTESTVGDILVMCLALGMRHNLTWAAQVDILEMVNTIFGRSVIPSSKYKYLQNLDDGKVKADYHVVCKVCEGYIGLRAGVKGCMYCNICEKDVDVTDPLNYFLSLPIEPQLKRILENDSVAESMLTYRFTREKIYENSLEDIYDGSVYKKLSNNNGILSSKYNFSYSFFSDGCPYGKSSNKTIWPIFIQFNELPPDVRANFICLVGIYVGPKDPNLNAYLTPFVEQANRLSEVGIKWEHRGEQITSKLVPLCCIADSVARPSILNMQTFSAGFGCTYCYHKSAHTARGQRFLISGLDFDSRTLQSLEEDLAKAFLVCDHNDPLKRHHRGVKGPTPLLNLNYFSVLKCVPVDYMHNLLLGVARTHMELLFATEHRNFWVKRSSDKIALASLEAAIDERLLKIRPPAFLPRTPRSIKNRKLWKASEWLAWLLFYCIPCLIGILHDFQVIHLAMLSKAAFLLLQKSITVQSVNEAHELLLSYTCQFQKHFGESEMVYNVHLLQHVGDGILRFGGLWTHNAFSFEGQNKFLLQLCKSPNLVAVQAANKFLIYNSFCSIADRLLKSEKPAEFCSKLMKKRLKFYSRVGDLVLVGDGKLFENPTLEERICLTAFDLNYTDCMSYKKCIYRGIRYVCDNFFQQTKQCDSYFCTDTNEVFVLKHILKFSGNVVMIAQMVLVDGEIVNRPNPVNLETKIVLSHIQETSCRGNLTCIKPDEIKEPCIFIDTGHGSYISSVPYGAHVS